MSDIPPYEPGQYPAIDSMIAAITTLGLQLTAEVTEQWLRDHSFSTVRLKTPNWETLLHVEDEFRDGQAPKNPAILLHLVLWSMAHYDEAEDILVWSNEVGLAPGDPMTLSIYRDWGKWTPKLRTLLGASLEPLSDWDYTMNTTITQVLRSMEWDN